MRFFVRYCLARLEEQLAERTYRIYVTDALRAIAENTSRATASGGYVMLRRFAELFEPEERRSGGEIAEAVIKKCGLEVI